MEAVMEWQAAENGLGAGGHDLVREGLSPPPQLQAEEAVEPARLNGAEMEEELAGPAVEERPPEQHQQPEVAAYVDCYADVRVLSQTVLITAFDMERRSFTVYTELDLIPLQPDITSFFINLGQNARLPSELSERDGRVTVNDIDAEYARIPLFQNLASTCQQHSMCEFKRARERILEDHQGELQIRIPDAVLPLIRQLTCVKLSIEVYVENPKNGVQFNYAKATDEHTRDRMAHAYTFRNGPVSTTKEWLPCLDAPDQLALWTMHFVCESDLTVIAAGELTDVVYADGEEKEKIYHFQQLFPTSAANIGWAIGQFTPHPHAEMAEMTSFSLPDMAEVVRHTVQNLDRTFEYFEELLSCRYPFPSYKQIFVDNLADDVICYSSLTLLSVTLLYNKKIIDVVQEVRTTLAFAIAQQFFGCLLSPTEFADIWLLRSLARFLTSLYIDKVFGHCEYLFQTKKILNEVCDYESQWGQLFLRAWEGSSSNHWTAPLSPFSCSSMHADMLFKKGQLVLRMLNKRLGKELFFQVLHKLVSVGEQMAAKREEPSSWVYLTLSTQAFFRTVTNVTGNEMPTFLEQWVYGGGHATFNVNFAFNRKRNMIELDISQVSTGKNGRLSYVGPLTVVVQELDGSFTHILQIDADSSRHELQCHSKGRRQKKKKVPLSTGEEVDVDLTNMDPESPVLWVRVDPDLLLLRSVHLRQPAYQWEYLLKYERDCLAQLQALQKIEQFPSAASRAVLVEAMQTEYFYYRVRCRAAISLCEVQNKLSDIASGRPPLMAFFTEKFGCKSAPHLPLSNNFLATSNQLQLYFLKQVIPQALGRTRSPSVASLTEIHTFLHNLIYFNDNSTNRYSDDYYRAALLSALSWTVQESETLEGNASNPGALSGEVATTIQELTLALNMDSFVPSYRRVVGSAALLGIYQVQKCGFVPSNVDLYWKFAQPNIHVQMRKTALWMLAERLSTERSGSSRGKESTPLLLSLIDMSLKDEDPSIRKYIPEQLIKHPFFHAPNSGDLSHPLNTPEVVKKIWDILVSPDTDPLIRSLYGDFWFTLYGWTKPLCLMEPGTAASQPEDLTLNQGLRVVTSYAYTSGLASDKGEVPAPPSPLLLWHSADACRDPPSSPTTAIFEESNEDRLQ